MRRLNVIDDMTQMYLLNDIQCVRRIENRIKMNILINGDNTDHSLSNLMKRGSRQEIALTLIR